MWRGVRTRKIKKEQQNFLKEFYPIFTYGREVKKYIKGKHWDKFSSLAIVSCVSWWMWFLLIRHPHHPIPCENYSAVCQKTFEALHHIKPTRDVYGAVNFLLKTLLLSIWQFSAFVHTFIFCFCHPRGWWNLSLCWQTVDLFRDSSVLPV